jgi:hypothetical protein
MTKSGPFHYSTRLVEDRAAELQLGLSPMGKVSVGDGVGCAVGTVRGCFRASSPLQGAVEQPESC